MSNAASPSSNIQSGVPNPEFILQNSFEINQVLFSAKQNDLFYSTNRNGDLNVYNLELRRSVFKSNPNNGESLLSILELDNLDLLTHSRNGSIFRWTKSEANWTSNCNFLFIVIIIYCCL